MNKLTVAKDALVESILHNDVFETDQFFTDKSAYSSLFGIFAKATMRCGSFKYLLNQGSLKFNEIYTPQTEALLFTVLESNLPRWKAENLMKLSKLQQGQTFDCLYKMTLSNSQRNNLPLPRYTQQRDANNNLTTGWTIEGIKAFNAYVLKINTFRKTPEFEAFAEWAIAEYDRDANNSLRRKKRKRSDEDVAKETQAYDAAYNEVWATNKFSV